MLTRGGEGGIILHLPPENCNKRATKNARCFQLVEGQISETFTPGAEGEKVPKILVTVREAVSEPPFRQLAYRRGFLLGFPPFC